MLEVKSLTFGYTKDKTVFKDLSFSLQSGEILAVLGLNGAGKTTLLKALSLQIQLKGQIEIMGQSLGEFVKIRRRQMAILEDTPFLYSYLTIEEYLRFVVSLKEVDYNAVKDKAEQGMAHFNLVMDRRNLCKNLSFGQRKKVYLLSQLLCDPLYILMDEPTNGLDLQAILCLERMIEELRCKGAIVIYTSHNLSFLEGVDRKALILNPAMQPRLFNKPVVSEIRDLLLVPQC